MKKKIVMVGNTAWGMHRFRADLMREFILLGHDVTVIAPGDDWAKEIAAIGCKFLNLEVDRKGTNPITDLNYFLRLLRTFLALKPDVVLAYTIKPVLYASLAGRLSGAGQTIAITTGLGYIFSKNNLITKITKALYWLCLKFATQVWFLNGEDKNTFLQQNLVSENKVFILPGEGIDIDSYLPAKQTSSEINFTLISRMLWDKGVGIFVDCANELKKVHPEINFFVVGPVDEGNPEGISLRQLEQWHQDGSVRYLGSVSDVRPILSNTTCLVHPTFYKEGIPRILMEANAMEVPCITTNIPGCKEVIIDGLNGFLVTPADKNALMKALQKFLKLNDTERSRMGEFGRKRVTNFFSNSRVISNYRERLNL